MLDGCIIKDEDINSKKLSILKKIVSNSKKVANPENNDPNQQYQPSNSTRKDSNTSAALINQENTQIDLEETQTELISDFDMPIKLHELNQNIEKGDYNLNVRMMTVLKDFDNHHNSKSYFQFYNVNEIQDILKKANKERSFINHIRQRLDLFIRIARTAIVEKKKIVGWNMNNVLDATQNPRYFLLIKRQR